MADEISRVPRAVHWHGDRLRIIDQTRLPAGLLELDLDDVDEIVEAIRALRVRGAPAIGIAAAIGLVASLKPHLALPPAEFRRRLAEHAERIRAARPTAANPGRALDRLQAAAAAFPSASNEELWSRLRAEATAILEEDREMCRRIGEHGLSLLPEPATVLTHCNTGALATGGIGTAVAPVYLALERGRTVRVVATETRPLLQGSRLTAWELARAGADVTLITDGAAAAAMREMAVDAVIVGADRIAANGDVANKIGTYGLAVAARHHGIPFYVAAPTSTLDLRVRSGAGIPIERRAPDEVRRGFGPPTAPDEVPVYNAAFDITPAELVDAIVTERGVHRPPYGDSLDALAPGAPAGVKR
jgi:methylthioribose-1-phosphate isomerase